MTEKSNSFYCPKSKLAPYPDNNWKEFSKKREDSLKIKDREVKKKKKNQ